MSEQPKKSQEPMYQLLREENLKEFNARRAQGEKCNLRGVNLRGLYNVGKLQIKQGNYPARGTARKRQVRSPVHQQSISLTLNFLPRADSRMAAINPSS
jgi:hypothetical protein